MPRAVNGLKECSKCRAVKSVEAFSPNRQQLDGKHPRCKACVSAAMTARYHSRVATEEGRTAENAAAKARVRRYRTTDRGRSVVAQHNHRRRTLVGDADGPVIDLDLLWDRAAGQCYLCLGPLTGELHIDHVVPLSRGGAHELENLALTHKRCNLRKQAKLLYELDLPFDPPPAE